ncbi:MAG: glycosyltransferase [Fibromonadales bacterium]|nr:glycosyltransferase [Fibromonadales bacterium]
MIMQNMPKISVIVPIYNKELFLKKSVSSILEQTEKDIKIILVDDGSTDDSSKICEEFAKKDSRVLYKRKENGGLTSARNYGLRYASGEYIAFVDPDDYIEKDAYEKMLAYSKNADIVIGGLVNEIGKKRIFRVMPKNMEGFYKNEEIRRDILPRFLVYGKNVGKDLLLAATHIFLFKKKFLDEQGISSDESITYSEDWLFSLEAIFKAKTLVVLHNIHYHYVSNPLGLTENYNPKVIKDYIEVLRKLDHKGILSCIPAPYSANPNLILNFFQQAVRNLALKKDSVFNLSKELDTFFEIDYFRDLGKTIKPRNIYIKKRVIFYLIKFKCPLMLILLYKYIQYFNKNLGIKSLGSL